MQDLARPRAVPRSVNVWCFGCLDRWDLISGGVWRDPGRSRGRSGGFLGASRGGLGSAPGVSCEGSAGVLVAPGSLLGGLGPRTLLVNFCLVPQDGPRQAKRPQDDGPRQAKRPPNRPKTAPRWPRAAPRGPQDGPRRPQDGPGDPQDSPSDPLRRPQYRPKRTQDRQLGQKCRMPENIQKPKKNQ